MDRHIPIVISEGDPFTRGQHLGSSQAGRVRQAARAYVSYPIVKARGLHLSSLLPVERGRTR